MKSANQQAAKLSRCALLRDSAVAFPLAKVNNGEDLGLDQYHILRLAPRRDEKGNLRLVAEVLDFTGMMQATFNQIRQYAEGTPAAIIRMMESMATLRRFATRDEQRTSIQKHTDMLLRCGERSFRENADLEDLKKRYFEMQKSA